MRYEKLRLYVLFLGVCCLPFIFSQHSSAKVVQGSCGETAQFRYDSKEKSLEIFGSGAVTKTISVKKLLGRNTQKFSVNALTIGRGITTIQDASILKHAEGDGRVVTLPEGFQKIPNNMFSNLSFVEVKIPGCVTEIQKGAFWDQVMLERITVSSDNKKYSSQDGVLYSKDKSRLLYYPPERDARSFIVSDSVREIEDLAFHGNYKLRRVTLPVRLQKLGAGCFYECAGLEEINIDELYQLREIRDYHKKSDIQVNIPYQSDGDDDDYVYQDYLIYQKPDEYSTGYSSYYNGTGGVTPAYKEYYGTFEGTKLSSFSMSDQLEYVASETFRDCVPLHTFTIGKAFRGQINRNEFSQTSLSLYYLEIHDLTIHPENTAFVLKDHLLYTSDMTVLCQEICDQEAGQETLCIPKEVNCIADGAFYMDVLYTNIIVEGDLDEIGTAAFAGSRIASFTAEGRIGKLKNGAFMYCNKMTDWQCADGVAVMEENAFLSYGGNEPLVKAETREMFSWLQSFRETVSLRKLALFSAFMIILF